MRKNGVRVRWPESCLQGLWAGLASLLGSTGHPQHLLGAKTPLPTQTRQPVSAVTPALCRAPAPSSQKRAQCPLSLGKGCAQVCGTTSQRLSREGQAAAPPPGPRGQHQARAALAR